MVRNLFLTGGLALSLVIAGVAQTPAGPEAGDRGTDARARHGAGMGRVAGEVTAISGASLTIKTEDGSTAQIITTDNTRFMKEGGPVKLADLHPGDGLLAVGNMDVPNHALHAAMVMVEDAAQIKAMKENLGKTYITGRVTALDLDNARMTVERPDHVSQTIGFDETTSFKRAVRPARPADASGGGNANGGGNGGGMRGGGMGMMAGGAGLEQAFSRGESITLADIKVGDRVVATGSVKGGVFVPVHLLESPAGGGRRHEGEEPGGPGPSGSSGAGAASGTGPGGC